MFSGAVLGFLQRKTPGSQADKKPIKLDFAKSPLRINGINAILHPSPFPY
jgi:hypothetical protein